MMDFDSARKNMVETQLRTSGITDRRLLQVMAQIPRELFVPENRKALAYTDNSHPLTTGLRPRMVAPATPIAKLLQLAEVSTSDRVLDVGCATGYSTAVIAGLADHVTAIDDNPSLAAEATKNLEALHRSNAKVVVGPLGNGAKAEAPFDLIVIEGVVDSVPEALFDQLKDGGRLVALLREGATAVANLYVRSGSSVAARAEFNANMPPLELAKRPEDFVF
jgi:protein-L-isoaspartate(D-aspartate) O-methyltransferase